VKKCMCENRTLRTAREIIMMRERISNQREMLIMCIVKVIVKYLLISVNQEISVNSKIVHNPQRNDSFNKVVDSRKRRSLLTYFKVQSRRAQVC
jgi:hypothetical protein